MLKKKKERKAYLKQAENLNEKSNFKMVGSNSLFNYNNL